MLKLSEFRHNHHLSGVKMLVNFTRRGILVYSIFLVVIMNLEVLSWY